jgi:hypothetical protein
MGRIARTRTHKFGSVSVHVGFAPKATRIAARSRSDAMGPDADIQRRKRIIGWLLRQDALLVQICCLEPSL